MRDVHGYEPVWLDGEVSGFAPQGGYSHHAQKSIALGFLPSERIADGLEAAHRNSGRDARLPKSSRHPLFDPDGARMRG